LQIHVLPVIYAYTTIINDDSTVFFGTYPSKLHRSFGIRSLLTKSLIHSPKKRHASEFCDRLSALPLNMRTREIGTEPVVEHPDEDIRPINQQPPMRPSE
jgi:hypothetical protein